MENIVFDDGLIELNINNRGVIRFNPTDFNLYSRFFDICNKLQDIEKEYKELENQIDTTKDDPETIAKLFAGLNDIDRTVKRGLSDAFGDGNDIGSIFCGINIMSFGSNGERIVTNFLNSISPYIERGVSSYVNSAVAKAKISREQRRALGG